MYAKNSYSTILILIILKIINLKTFFTEFFFQCLLTLNPNNYYYIRIYFFIVYCRYEFSKNLHPAVKFNCFISWDQKGQLVHMKVD